MACKREVQQLEECLKLQSMVQEFQAKKVDISEGVKSTDWALNEQVVLNECVKNGLKVYDQCYQSIVQTGSFNDKRTDCVNPYLRAIRECRDNAQKS